MQRPADEKRMVVILEQADYDRLAAVQLGRGPSRSSKQWRGQLVDVPAPVPPRGTLPLNNWHCRAPGEVPHEVIKLFTNEP
jgi:hypothetical protein